MYASVEGSNAQMAGDIYPSEAWELISKNVDSEEVVLIDVSTSKEYEDLHLEGAVNLNIFSRFFKSRLSILDKTKTYIIYCKLGGRSKIALNVMRRLGFQKIYNIVGGTILWEEEGLPFAAGTSSANKFSFCPFFVTIVTFKKGKKIFDNILSYFVPKDGLTVSSRRES